MKNVEKIVFEILSANKFFKDLRTIGEWEAISSSKHMLRLHQKDPKDEGKSYAVCEFDKNKWEVSLFDYKGGRHKKVNEKKFDTRNEAFREGRKLLERL